MTLFDEPDVSLPCTPISSPSSGPVDSSPLASPNLSPISSSPPSPRVVHPFAASAKATRPPKLYEKREARRLIDLESLKDASDVSQTWKRVERDSNPQITPASPLSHDFAISPCEGGDIELDEQAFWEEKVSEAIDNGNGIIDLSISDTIHARPGPRGLRSIPASIGDLANLVVLQDPLRFGGSTPSAAYVSPKRIISRATTAPTGTPFPFSSMRLPKASSFAHSVTIRHPNEIQLFLSNHQIRFLPPELFRLQGLTVLTLRANQLTYIPPQIATLSNLRSLNVIKNNLTFLPAEMLNMQLDSLDVQMNPWLEPPSELTHPSRPSIVSKTVTRFTVPTLKEFIHRFLFSPAPPAGATSGEVTMLESMGGAAAIPDYFPPHIVEELHSCVPQLIPKPDVDIQPPPSKRARTHSPTDEPFSFLSERAAGKRRVDFLEMHPGVGVCPNPAHSVKSVFVRHAEERYTWEKIIAGRTVNEKFGVPMLWRGCSVGCLDFLQPDENIEKEASTQAEAEDSATAMETDRDDGVQVVDLSGHDDDFGFE